MPVAHLDQDLWILPPRLPLNDAHRGLCHATSEPFEPPERSQRELCNCGYARGRCETFPTETVADAVRFSITGERDGIVHLVFIMERDYAPSEHGLLDYSIAESRVMNSPSEILAAQARAFLASYLHRTSQAKACAT
jgi:hypothetical protein